MNVRERYRYAEPMWGERETPLFNICGDVTERDGVITMRLEVMDPHTGKRKQIHYQISALEESKTNWLDKMEQNPKVSAEKPRSR